MIPAKTVEVLLVPYGWRQGEAMRVVPVERDDAIRINVPRAHGFGRDSYWKTQERDVAGRRIYKGTRS